MMGPSAILAVQALLLAQVPHGAEEQEIYYRNRRKAQLFHHITNDADLDSKVVKSEDCWFVLTSLEPEHTELGGAYIDAAPEGVVLGVAVANDVPALKALATRPLPGIFVFTVRDLPNATYVSSTRSFGNGYLLGPMELSTKLNMELRRVEKERGTYGMYKKRPQDPPPPPEEFVHPYAAYREYDAMTPETLHEYCTTHTPTAVICTTHPSVRSNAAMAADPWYPSTKEERTFNAAGHHGQTMTPKEYQAAQEQTQEAG